MNKFHSAAFAFAALLMTSCASTPSTSAAAQPVGLANPASVNCIKLGGTSELMTSAEGQYRICKFPNGKQCEEWALLRGECKPE